MLPDTQANKISRKKRKDLIRKVVVFAILANNFAAF